MPLIYLLAAFVVFVWNRSLDVVRGILDIEHFKGSAVSQAMDFSSYASSSNIPIQTDTNSLLMTTKPLALLLFVLILLLTLLYSRSF